MILIYTVRLFGIFAFVILPTDHALARSRANGSSWIQTSTLQLSTVKPWYGLPEKYSHEISWDPRHSRIQFYVMSVSRDAGKGFIRRTAVNMRYAAMNGYFGFHCFSRELQEKYPDFDLHPNGHGWKPVCALELFHDIPMNSTQWMLFLDDDAFINPHLHHIPLSEFVTSDPRIHWSWHDRRDTTTGAFLVRNSFQGRHILHQWIEAMMRKHLAWSDQNAFRGVLIDIFQKVRSRRVDHRIEECVKWADVSRRDGGCTPTNCTSWSPKICDKVFQRAMIELGMPYPRAQRHISVTKPLLFLSDDADVLFQPVYNEIPFDALVSRAFIVHPGGRRGKLRKRDQDAFGDP